MKRSHQIWRTCAYLLVLALASRAAAFVPDERWSRTASGLTGPSGDPVTLTWSFAPDGTSIPGEGPSNLVSFLDTHFGEGEGGGDLTQRPWFASFEESLDRWTSISGLTYVYEPIDDGVRISGARGILGVRGDVRIAGANIDGDSGTLAYNGLPNDGDMVIDTSDVDFFTTESGNFRRLRNTIMHESGHGLGLLHVESDNAAFLMEPFISVAFDGPQLDDIRGVQSFYGDALEKANGGLGNDTPELATPLGTIFDGDSVVLGADAGPGLRVGATDTDFISIDHFTDVDIYSFSIEEPSSLTVSLRPWGGTFNQAAQGNFQSFFDANSISDLQFNLLAAGGNTELVNVNDAVAGDTETLDAFVLDDAGEYFIEILGEADNVQLYQLNLSVDSLLPDPSADFNGDGIVDGDDLLAMLLGFGTPNNATLAMGDADFDGDVDRADLAIWSNQSAQTVPAGPPLGQGGVPEPGACALASVLLISACVLVRRILPSLPNPVFLFHKW